MPVLSIIACGMLEDELVHVLSKDHELKLLIVVENRNNLGFLRKLRSKDSTPRTVYLDRIPLLLEGEHCPDLKIYGKSFSLFPFFKEMYEKRKLMEKKKLTVVVNLLRPGLHSDLDLLKAEVYKSIREMSPFSDNILIFYGICGHTLGKLKEDFADLGCPLSFLKDGEGEIVEDCISLALGGNEAYARTMLEYSGRGTFYLTPMWASTWKQLQKETKIEKEYINLFKHYSLAAKLDTGIANDPEFDENVREYARTFGMKVITLKGSMEVAERSYLAAKNAITGK